MSRMDHLGYRAAEIRRGNLFLVSRLATNKTLCRAAGIRAYEWSPAQGSWRGPCSFYPDDNGHFQVCPKEGFVAHCLCG